MWSRVSVSYDRWRLLCFSLFVCLFLPFSFSVCFGLCCDVYLNQKLILPEDHCLEAVLCVTCYLSTQSNLEWFRMKRRCAILRINLLAEIYRFHDLTK